jgi:hypothetical protein
LLAARFICGRHFLTFQELQFFRRLRTYLSGISGVKAPPKILVARGKTISVMQMSRSRLIALLLLLVTLIVYFPVAGYDFSIFDDNDYVAKNVVVQNGLTWSGLRWAFTTGYAGNWHPLTWISHMTDCELFGLKPGAHHMVNSVFHAANAVLVFVLLLRLTNAFWPSAFASALFAWHPLRVESVAWISERKDVLSIFFALLVLLAYTRYAEKKSQAVEEKSNIAKFSKFKPSVFDYGLALFFFALSLLAKPTAVTLPFVMLLLDFWPLGRLRSAKCEVQDMKSSNPQPFIVREITVLCVVCGIVRCHVSGPARGRLGSLAGESSVWRTLGKCAGGLCELFAENDLAGASGGFVSTVRTSFSAHCLKRHCLVNPDLHRRLVRAQI